MVCIGRECSETRLYPLSGLCSAEDSDPAAHRLCEKNAYESDDHGALHWGPGHLGVAAGMLEGVRNGVLTREQADELLCVTVVWIWATATDPDRVCLRTAEATLAALEQAMTDTPDLDTVESIVQQEGLTNPYYSIPPLQAK